MAASGYVTERDRSAVVLLTNKHFELLLNYPHIVIYHVSKLSYFWNPNIMG